MHSKIGCPDAGFNTTAEKLLVLEIQQNLDNCIGESRKTKHLIEVSQS